MTEMMELTVVAVGYTPGEGYAVTFEGDDLTFTTRSPERPDGVTVGDVIHVPAAVRNLILNTASDLSGPSAGGDASAAETLGGTDLYLGARVRVWSPQAPGFDREGTLVGYDAYTDHPFQVRFGSLANARYSAWELELI